MVFADMKRSGLILILLWSLALSETTAQTVSVDFSAAVGTIRFAYGANEYIDMWSFNPYSKRYSYEARQTIIRIWVNSDMYGLGFAESPSNMRWQWLDAPVYDALNAQAVPMIAVTGPPPYLAVDGNTTGHGRPSDYAAFGQFFVAIAQHYVAAGRPAHEWYYEVWNEPNNTEVSGPMSASTYTAIFDAVQSAMHAADPRYKVGGPSTDGAPSSYIDPVLDRRADFITWHRYGAWDPGLQLPDSTYLQRAADYQSLASFVAGRIAARRPGESIPQFCGELNWNGSYAPIDPRIWQPVNIAFYVSAIRNLILGGCNGELIYTGSDGESQRFGLWLTRGTNAGKRSPLYWGRRLWAEHVYTGAQRVASTNATNVEVMAVKDGTRHAVALIHKASGQTSLTVQLAGMTPVAGTLRVADAAAATAAAIRETYLAPATFYAIALSGYGVWVLSFDTASPAPTPTPTPRPPSPVLLGAW